MSDQHKIPRFGRMSLFSMLVVTSMFASFFAGRVSQEAEIGRLKEENKKYVRMQKKIADQNGILVQFTKTQIRQFDQFDKSDSIEQGMKASELEMKSRLNY